MSWLETHGFVYVVSDGTAYKVGETGGCVYDRLKCLQGGNPRKIEFIHCYETPDRKECEKYLHKQLQGFKCAGGEEWFDCTLADIEGAAAEIERLFGAVKAEPFKLKRTQGTFTREVVDYWVMGDTLTLQLEWSEGDHRNLNFTLESNCKRSQAAGESLLKDLRKLLKVQSRETMMQKIRTLASWHRPSWIITYKRKRSLWLGLNDFELISLKYEPRKELVL